MFRTGENSLVAINPLRVAWGCCLGACLLGSQAMAQETGDTPAATGSTFSANDWSSLSGSDAVSARDSIQQGTGDLGNSAADDAILSPDGMSFPLPASTLQLPSPTESSEPADREGRASETPASPLGQVVASYQGNLLTRGALTGDWAGGRTALANHGILVYADTTLFAQGVTSGGLRERFHFYGHNDYVFVGVGKQLGLWDGLFVKVRGESRYGDDAANFDAGTILSPAINASIPVPNEQITAVTELLFIQKIGERTLFQAGKINTLDGDPLCFAAGRGKRQFFNTSFVFNPVLARTVPYTTLGAGVVVLSEKLEPVFAFSVMDADPTPRTSGFTDLFDEITLSTSARIPVSLWGRNGHQAVIGSWSNKVYTGLELDPRVLIDDLPVLPQRNGSWALSYSFDQYVLQNEEDPTRGWGLFGRLGISDGDPNPIEWFWSLGIGGSGVMRSRPLDSFGVGYFALGPKSGTALDTLAQIRDSWGVELFYNVALTPWARVTPDLQILSGGLPRAETALLFGLRTQIIF